MRFTVNFSSSQCCRQQDCSSGLWYIFLFSLSGIFSMKIKESTLFPAERVMPPRLVESSSGGALFFSVPHQKTIRRDVPICQPLLPLCSFIQQLRAGRHHQYFIRWQHCRYSSKRGKGSVKLSQVEFCVYLKACLHSSPYYWWLQSKRSKNKTEDF